MLASLQFILIPKSILEILNAYLLLGKTKSVIFPHHRRNPILGVELNSKFFEILTQLTRTLGSCQRQKIAVRLTPQVSIPLSLQLIPEKIIFLCAL